MIPCGLDSLDQPACQQDGERRQNGQDVSRLLPDREREEQQRHDRPEQQSPVGVGELQCPLPRAGETFDDEDREEERPRQQTAEEDGKIEPERPCLVESLGGETLEVVRDKKALKVRVAVLEPHRDVPRQPDDRGGHDGHGHSAHHRGADAATRATRLAAAQGPARRARRAPSSGSQRPRWRRRAPTTSWPVRKDRPYARWRRRWLAARPRS